MAEAAAAVSASDVTSAAEDEPDVLKACNNTNTPVSSPEQLTPPTQPVNLSQNLSTSVDDDSQEGKLEVNR